MQANWTEAALLFTLVMRRCFRRAEVGDVRAGPWEGLPSAVLLGQKNAPDEVAVGVGDGRRMSGDVAPLNKGGGRFSTGVVADCSSGTDCGCWGTEVRGVLALRSLDASPLSVSVAGAGRASPEPDGAPVVSCSTCRRRPGQKNPKTDNPNCQHIV